MNKNPWGIIWENMLTGKIVQKFKVEDLGLITIRYPKMNDAQDLLEYLNSLIKEEVFTINEEKNMDWELDKHSTTLKEIEKGKRISLVVEVDNKVMGLGDVVKKPGARSHSGELGFGLRKKIRKKGIGTELMKALINESKKELGIEQIILKTYRSNKPALNLYKNFNYEEVGEIKNGAKYGEKYKDVVIMKKDLEN